MKVLSSGIQCKLLMEFNMKIQLPLGSKFNQISGGTYCLCITHGSNINYRSSYFSIHVLLHFFSNGFKKYFHNCQNYFRYIICSLKMFFHVAPWTLSLALGRKEEHFENVCQESCHNWYSSWTIPHQGNSIPAWINLLCDK
jgi:hypothetical protein